MSQKKVGPLRIPGFVPLHFSSELPRASFLSRCSSSTLTSSILKGLIVLTLAAFATRAQAQASATATRLADGQVGVSYVNGQSDFEIDRYNGYGIYANLDFHRGFGIEADFHFMSDHTPSNIYERTYEIGGRYSRHYGRFQPYAKAMVGRGVFNQAYGVSNLAYNLLAVGVGTDYRIVPRINARVEYEYQDWLSFQDKGLNPSLLSVGLAYHFK